MIGDDGFFLNYKTRQIYVPQGHFAEEAIKKGGIPESHIDRVLEKTIRPGSVAIDVGANIGFHTITMSDAVQHGVVYAVEADIDNALCLAKTLRVNRIQNTRLLPIAASDVAGLIHLASSKGSNSVFSPSTKSSQKAAVCARLDDCIKEKVDVVKIDIEGAEVLALLGMPRILLARPALIMEFSPGYIENNLGVDRSGEILEMVFGLGYDCHYISPEGIMEKLVNAEAVVSKRNYAFHELGWGHIDLLCNVA